MSSMVSFSGWIPRKSKIYSREPDFAGPLAIGQELWDAGIWVNHCNDARPYLSARLKQYGSGDPPIRLPLWQKEPVAQFAAEHQVDEIRLLFSAWVTQHGVKLQGEPAGSWSEKLTQAKVALTIPVLWRILGLPGTIRPHCCVRSPLRQDDHNPSFSIYDEGRRFKDHGTGDGGDALDFFRLATQLDSKTAYKQFLELAAIPPLT